MTCLCLFRKVSVTTEDYEVFAEKFTGLLSPKEQDSYTNTSQFDVKRHHTNIMYYLARKKPVHK